VQPWLTPLELRSNVVLHAPGDPIGCVYFPLSGMISLRAVMQSGEAIETGIVGADGGAAREENSAVGVSAAGLFARYAEGVKLPPSPYSTMCGIRGRGGTERSSRTAGLGRNPFLVRPALTGLRVVGLDQFTIY
jgi:hypothetical protein